MAYWNWGVHFGGRNAPNHFSFLRNERIVIGVANQQNYAVGDYVAIMDGFVVLAVVQVTASPQPITTRPRYQATCQAHNIAWNGNTVFAKAEWRVLGRVNLQNGAGEIQDPIIQNSVLAMFNAGAIW